MSAQSGGTTQRSALMPAGLDFAIRMPSSRIAYQGSWSQRNCIRPARVCCWHLADNSVAPALGRYWSNNGHWPGLARNASVVNDPKQTFASDPRCLTVRAVAGPLGSRNQREELMLRFCHLSPLAVLAAFLGFAAPLHAQSIIDEWPSVQAPPAPELTSVTVDPKTTALLMLD